MFPSFVYPSEVISFSGENVHGCSENMHHFVALYL
jgi:hypothetical protein